MADKQPPAYVLVRTDSWGRLHCESCGFAAFNSDVMQEHVQSHMQPLDAPPCITREPMPDVYETLTPVCPECAATLSRPSQNTNRPTDERLPVRCWGCQQRVEAQFWRKQPAVEPKPEPTFAPSAPKLAYTVTVAVKLNNTDIYHERYAQVSEAGVEWGDILTAARTAARRVMREYEEKLQP